MYDIPDLHPAAGPPGTRAADSGILTALEGSAVIGCESRDHELPPARASALTRTACTASPPKGRFKMSLLLVLE